ncbi:hypothetical protein SELMODRAFT_116576 [Selaginella moellendorffii]|uniref:Pentacotripeptide-repeat region of PRORP domain-containing protein n=2 Tax=Selaginella moellendorffii TaxID=88036 RepID=D8SH14_SELML|nr:hypothetical protein SELMODRAFT_116576 [Selaginella moellendorffii]
MPERDTISWNVLLTIFVQAGALAKAEKTFATMFDHDLVSWNAMLAAYAQNGHPRKAVEVFLELNLRGAIPDSVAFLSLLTVCNHLGLITRSIQLFSSMHHDFGVIQSQEHYACIVDVIGRCGELQNAKDVIHSMPCKPNLEAWGAMLGASTVQRDSLLGGCAATKVLEFDTSQATSYVMLSNALQV